VADRAAQPLFRFPCLSQGKISQGKTR